MLFGGPEGSLEVLEDGGELGSWGRSVGQGEPSHSPSTEQHPVLRVGRNRLLPAAAGM